MAHWLSMKRFTETLKWRDPWFRKLTPAAKLLWSYLVDNCNPVGLIDLDIEAASFDIGLKINASHIAELGKRVQVVEGDRLFVTKFIHFQYGHLSKTCVAHKRAIEMVAHYGLIEKHDEYDYPEAGAVKNPANGIAEKPEREESYHPDTRTALYWLNEKSNRKYREVDSNLSVISARLSEPGVDIEGVKRMIERQCVRWLKDPKMVEFLRPDTLFGKEKFDNYYAAKDLPVAAAPVSQQDLPSSQGGANRNAGTFNDNPAIRNAYARAGQPYTEPKKTQ